MQDLTESQILGFACIKENIMKTAKCPVHKKSSNRMKENMSSHKEAKYMDSNNIETCLNFTFAQEELPLAALL